MVRANYQESKEFFSEFICEEPEQEQIIIDEEKIIHFQKLYTGFTKPMAERAALKYEMDRILVNYNVFPLHASAMSYRGNAYILTALSGVGKSTHAKLWKEAFPDEVIMINDDRPYIKLEDTGAYAYSHPQAGKHNIFTNTSSPIKVIAKIVRDNRNFVRPLSNSEFFPFLVQQTFTMDEPVITARIITLIKNVICHAHLFEIHCQMDGTTALEICAQIENAIGIGRTE